MKMSKFKRAVLVLLTITMIYAMFVMWSFIEYNTYISTIIARYEALGISVDFVTPFRYIDFWYGEAALLIGIGLTVSWVFIASNRRNLKKKPAVNPLEACSPPSPKRRAEREQKAKWRK